jgi:hypothetical protein
MTAPERSAAQRAEALAAALAARRERADLRAALKGRRVTGAAVLDGASDNQVWAGVRVSWLLESLPGVGPVRAERVMADLGIAPSRRLQGLGEHQWAALRTYLLGREQRGRGLES